MKTLLLMRHAKSDRTQMGMRDFDRPLNKRGRHDAPAIAHFLEANGLVPGLALISSAARTRETWELMAKVFGKPPAFEFVRELYMARPQTILSLIKETPSDISKLMILAHNPGIEVATKLLAAAEQDEAGQAALREIEEKFPTATVAHLGFDTANWEGIAFGDALLRSVTKPRTLQA